MSRRAMPKGKSAASGIGARSPIAQVAAGVAACLTLGAPVVWLASFLGRFGWIADTLSHFRVFGIVASVSGGLVLVVLRHRKGGAFGIAAGLAVAATLLPYYRGGSHSVLDRKFRAVSLNVGGGNRAYGEVEKLLRDEAPDVVVLSEVNAAWFDAIQSWKVGLPYTVIEPRDDYFGIALLSKHPLASRELVHLGRAGTPTVVAELELGGSRLALLGTHLITPKTPRLTALRNEQMALLAGLVRRQTPPVLLLGDLNVTPWSFAFDDLLHDGNLKNGRAGQGILPTWPTRLPFRIPLDHALHTEGVAMGRLSLGRHVGSDHRPLIVEFDVRGPRR